MKRHEKQSVYLIRKFIALNRHENFEMMKTVYTEKDLFTSYLTLTLLDRERLQGIQKLMKLKPDDYVAFDRVMGIIGDQHVLKEKDNLDLFAQIQKRSSKKQYALKPDKTTRMQNAIHSVRKYFQSFFPFR
jgi:hypothetical protein